MNRGGGSKFETLTLRGVLRGCFDSVWATQESQTRLSPRKSNEVGLLQWQSRAPCTAWSCRARYSAVQPWRPYRDPNPRCCSRWP